MFVGLCPGLRVELCDTVTVLQRDETVGERELPNQIIRGQRVQGVARSVHNSSQCLQLTIPTTMPTLLTISGVLRVPEVLEPVLAIVLIMLYFESDIDDADIPQSCNALCSTDNNQYLPSFDCSDEGLCDLRMRSVAFAEQPSGTYTMFLGLVLRVRDRVKRDQVRQWKGLVNLELYSQETFPFLTFSRSLRARKKNKKKKKQKKKTFGRIDHS